MICHWPPEGLWSWDDPTLCPGAGDPGAAQGSPTSRRRFPGAAEDPSRPVRSSVRGSCVPAEAPPWGLRAPLPTRLCRASMATEDMTPRPHACPWAPRARRGRDRACVPQSVVASLEGARTWEWPCPSTSTGWVRVPRGHAEAIGATLRSQSHHTGHSGRERSGGLRPVVSFGCPVWPRVGRGQLYS